MGVNSKDIGELVLQIADVNLHCPQVNSAKEYFIALEKTVKTLDNLPKFEEACKELKENIQGYAGAIYGQGCPKIFLGSALAVTGGYMGVQLSTHGTAIVGFPIVLLSYFVLRETFRGTRERVMAMDRCVEAPELTWRWAIHSYRKDIQKKIEEFYGAI